MSVSEETPRIVTIEGRKARVLDITAEDGWDSLFEEVWRLDADGRRRTDEFTSLSHNDEFWVLGEPPRIYRVVEWL
jgi:hypothetical protein